MIVISNDCNYLCWALEFVGAYIVSGTNQEIEVMINRKYCNL